jgi:hypothetical protein
MKKRWKKPTRLTFWMLARPNGDWVSDAMSEDGSPFVYATRADALESGWNLPTNPCRAVKVRIQLLR